MEPKGPPKESQNRLKSAKMLPKTPPKRVWRRSLEKVASRTLPETSPYASRTVPAMLFTLPRGCPQARFWLHFGSLLATCGAQKSPKERKRGLPKKLQNTTPKKVPLGAKMEPKRSPIQTKSRQFLAPFSLTGTLGPRMGPGPHFGSIFHRKFMIFNEIQT